jgi:hypothetical protein
MGDLYAAQPLGEGDLYAAQARLCWFSLVPGVGARAVPLAYRGSRGRQQAAAPYSRSWSFPLFKYHFK